MPHQYTWQSILGIVREHRTDLITAHIVAILAAVASVPIPLLMPLLVDEVLLHQPGRLVAWLDSLFPTAWQGPVLYIGAVLALTLALRLTALILGVWQGRSFTLIAKDVVFRMREQMLLRLSRIAMSEYETLGSGAVASHFVKDLDAMDTFIGASVSRFLVALLSIIGTAIVLLWMHWQLALFILLLNPAVIYFTTVLGKRVKDLKKRENSAFELFQQALTETLDAIQQIRASNRERHYIARVIDRARGIRSDAAAFSWQSDAAGRLSFVVFLFGFDVFRAISMLMVVYSSLSIGQMMAVFGYLWFMMGPVQEILGIQYAFYAAKAALGRINRLLELKDEPHYPQRQDPFAGKHTVGVEVDDVRFSYGDAPVLNGVSLRIRPGEKVALVGASGGGKSTLVQVLLGLYPPDSGTVRFAGVPMTEIGMEVVRSHVATVLQHPALFNDTVRMNLTLGRELGDQQLWQALDVAQLAATVRELPNGLDTIVGRQGVRLSGGQRQRLAIARMVLSNPSIVILDEATSALDAETEARLHAALRGFLQNRTTLIIAHRLSAVKQADRAYVFDGGQIIEEGRHDELIKGEGLYSRLYGQLQH
ncbi:ABC transporter ATP-binding protein [Accumulibacter sp.]|uniref:ABC transporter ATP-binding protein n=1 Tax=Accumulibacter sp. TaxID=2053492 RepID=UPI0025F87B9A|nr:ABC transporter ATP-binding protein [Accumulibacter sp.]MCM8613399.1 ABC transporter ATP-binding protein/permease [Accumulibacter sp.]MCM8634571.1 ABC transporter ATP-binding protein/permease [Accumulibacter sp.]MCM8641651.1 ABC transporter ATP-binding protein/permease [Accumulibacter sp.]